MSVRKYDVVCASDSLCSLNETQEPPNEYHENTDWILGCIFDLGLVIQWTYIYVCMSIWLSTFFAYANCGCSSMTIHMCILVWAFTNDKNQPALHNGSVVECSTWDLEVPDFSLMELLLCVIEQDIYPYFSV